MFDYKEYTRLRDIAQKRIKRAEKAGFDIGQTSFPTVQELKQNGPVASAAELLKLQHFIEEGTSLSRDHVREYSQSESAIKSRRYRREIKAREAAGEDIEKQKKYIGYLKAVKTLGVDIPPSKLPEFFAYMDYRFSQGAGSKQYIIDVFIDDYAQMLRKGYNPGQIIKDFQQFEADQIAIQDRAGKMEGMNYDKAKKLWKRFMNSD